MQAKTREAKRSFAPDTQMARLATRMMLGESLESLGLKDKVIVASCHLLSEFSQGENSPMHSQFCVAKLGKQP